MTDQLKEEHLEARMAACDHCPLLIQVREGRVKLETTSEIWKWIATTSFGVICGLVIFWFSGSAQAVTRTDMENFIRSYSPYAIDRNMVTQSLQDLKDGQRQINQQLAVVKERQDKVIAVMEDHVGKPIK